MTTSQPDKTYYKTKSMCPTCGDLVPGSVFPRGEGVFLGRHCSNHGYFEALVCSDIQWYEGLSEFDVDPIRPPGALAPIKSGCPDDCGLCKNHLQMAGTAAMEISNRCDANCPICLADNQATFDLTVQEVEGMLDHLFKTQPSVDTVTLSGGEPTIHPQLFDILDAISKRSVSRIAINSNGIRISKDDQLLDRLSKYSNVYIALHTDGPGAKEIRGIDPAIQTRALDRLLEWGINVVPTTVAVKDVNDTAMGGLIRNLLTKSEYVKTFMISLVAHTGANGTRFPGDPVSRLTIPGALDAISQGSEGFIPKSAFIPLPMPNPLCAAIGYFLVFDKEITPLIPLAKRDDVIHFTKNANFGNVGEEHEKLFRRTIDHVYANPDLFDNSEILLSRLKQLLITLFPRDRVLTNDQRTKLAEKSIKSVYLFQLMDPWTFDTTRLKKCFCQHLLPGDRTIPSCAYYSYHRRFDPRFSSERVESLPV